jgi:hypothetical protein
MEKLKSYSNYQESPKLDVDIDPLLNSTRIAVMDLTKETIRTKGHKPLLDVFQLVDIS